LVRIVKTILTEIETTAVVTGAPGARDSSRFNATTQEALGDF